jgi:hypothetical protein
MRQKMKSLFNNDDRLNLAERLEGLTEESKPQWGKMNCEQMLAHVADGLRMALGELPVQSKGGPLRFRPLRHAIIYWFPFPKGAPTAPELLERNAEDCTCEVIDIKSLLERFAARDEIQEWPEHPAFGQLSRKDWGVLSYKHIDHHLRQFGA